MRTSFLVLGFITLFLIGLGVWFAKRPLDLINAITPGSHSEKTLGLSYGTDVRQKLDIYRPIAQDQAAPVVVFFYGGSWNRGERADYAFVGEALAARGMVAVLVDYRVYPQVRYPAFLDDVAMAVAWSFKEINRYGGDPQNIFLMGHSAGAYNAAMLALDETWLAKQGASAKALRGLIGLAGPYDFIPIVNPEVRPVFFFPNTPAESQPINHVSANAPPSLLIAPLEDQLVNPQRNTGGLAKRLREAGVKVTETYYKSTSHTSLVGAIAWPLRGLAPVLDDVANFVAENRKTLTSAKAIDTKKP